LFIIQPASLPCYSDNLIIEHVFSLVKGAFLLYTESRTGVTGDEVGFCPSRQFISPPTPSLREKGKLEAGDFLRVLLKSIVTSANGYAEGISKPFNALVDSGAFHTCVSDKIMDDIIKNVRDENHEQLEPVSHGNAGGIYGDIHKEPIYILPNFYLGNMHLENVAVMVLRNSNIDCLIGRSILHQCVLTLDSEENAMTFDFRETLKSGKQRMDGVVPFSRVKVYLESVEKSQCLK